MAWVTKAWFSSTSWGVRRSSFLSMTALRVCVVYTRSSTALGGRSSPSKSFQHGHGPSASTWSPTVYSGCSPVALVTVLKALVMRCLAAPLLVAVPRRRGSSVIGDSHHIWQHRLHAPEDCFERRTPPRQEFGSGI